MNNKSLDTTIKMLLAKNTAVRPTPSVNRAQGIGQAMF